MYRRKKNEGVQDVRPKKLPSHATMKDIFTLRAQCQFYETTTEFLNSLSDVFPECECVSRWKVEHAATETRKEEAVQRWIAELSHPLQRGTARYIRAIKSITGQVGTMYHALVYHDAQAIAGCSDLFRSMDLTGKLNSMEAQHVVIFWQYMEEMSRTAYASARQTPPNVPTAAEISADIIARKGRTSDSKPALQTGLLEMWHKLCEMRGVECPDKFESVVSKLSTLSAVVEGGGETTVADVGNAGDGEAEGRNTSPPASQAVAAVLEAFPYLTDKQFSIDEWTLLGKCVSLATMHSNIPAPMMQGIENVANQLVADISSGRADLASLDINDIGKRVLSGVSQSDMSTFAQNIDKILPAVRRSM